MDDQALKQSTVLVIFGISGDLSRRYLLPSLAEIGKVGRLPAEFKLLGISRRALELNSILPENTSKLAGMIELLQMDPSHSADYAKLKTAIDDLSKSFSQKPQVIFYLSVPPAAVQPIVRMLGEAGLSEGTKLMLEKPFGVDLQSAKALGEQIAGHFKEEQIYRIDHYLAKEMAQNIVVFWGSNTIFRDVWNSRYVERIEVLAAEKVGIEGRAEFYEATGALRDFTQNHLLQLAALVLMEPCSSLFEFEELPQRRLAALRQLQTAAPGQALRGQYEGYRQEVKDPNSNVETFVALSLSSENPRWAGVPIQLITGKSLDQRLSEIRIHFKKTDTSEANCLNLRIQPDEAIELELWVKQPGYERKLQKQNLSFHYQQTFDSLPNAYEQVLVDAMRGSHSLFASGPEILESWRILQPLLDAWSQNSDQLLSYKPGATVQQLLNQ